MKVFFDSHVLVWAIYKPELIGKETRRLLLAADEHYVSVVSLWELGLKYKTGKLPFSVTELFEGVKSLGATLLPLTPAHISQFEHITLSHKDPFDTLLIAQSEREDCIFVTSDSEILKTGYTIHNAKT